MEIARFCFTIRENDFFFFFFFPRESNRLLLSVWCNKKMWEGFIFSIGSINTINCSTMTTFSKKKKKIITEEQCVWACVGAHMVPKNSKLPRRKRPLKEFLARKARSRRKS